MISPAAPTTLRWISDRAAESSGGRPGTSQASKGTDPMEALLHSGISESPCSPAM
jgi:hypothetical protein